MEFTKNNLGSYSTEVRNTHRRRAASAGAPHSVARARRLRQVGLSPMRARDYLARRCHRTSKRGRVEDDRLSAVVRHGAVGGSRALHCVVRPHVSEGGTVVNVELSAVVAGVVPGDIAGEDIAQGGLARYVADTTSRHRTAPVVLHQIADEHVARHRAYRVAVYADTAGIAPHGVVEDEIVAGRFLHLRRARMVDEGAAAIQVFTVRQLT